MSKQLPELKTPQQKFSFKAIGFGFLSSIGANLIGIMLFLIACSFALSSAGASPNAVLEEIVKFESVNYFLLLILVWSSVMGGRITYQAAPWGELYNAAVVGLIFSVIFLSTVPLVEGPKHFQVLSGLICLPATCLGAYTAAPRS